MLLESGRRYRATINDVPFFLGKGTIVSKLSEAGFTSVTAWRTDGQWYAEAVWNGPTQEVEPSAVSSHIGQVWPVNQP